MQQLLGGKTRVPQIKFPQKHTLTVFDLKCFILDLKPKLVIKGYKAHFF